MWFKSNKSYGSRQSGVNVRAVSALQQGKQSTQVGGRWLIYAYVQIQVNSLRADGCNLQVLFTQDLFGCRCKTKIVGCMRTSSESEQSTKKSCIRAPSGIRTLNWTSVIVASTEASKHLGQPGGWLVFLMKQRDIMHAWSEDISCVNRALKKWLQDFLSSECFQGKDDSAALSPWTRYETHSLPEQVLSSELSVIAGYSAPSHAHSQIYYPVRHKAN